MIIGYVRVSTKDQSLDRQRDELTGAGCEQVHEEYARGNAALCVRSGTRQSVT